MQAGFCFIFYDIQASQAGIVIETSHPHNVVVVPQKRRVFAVVIVVGFFPEKFSAFFKILSKPGFGMPVAFPFRVSSVQMDDQRQRSGFGVVPFGHRHRPVHWEQVRTPGQPIFPAHERVRPVLGDQRGSRGVHSAFVLEPPDRGFHFFSGRSPQAHPNPASLHAKSQGLVRF